MMQDWTPDLIVTTLTTGVMEDQARELTRRERRVVAEYISGSR